MLDLERLDRDTLAVLVAAHRTEYVKTYLEYVERDTNEAHDCLASFELEAVDDARA